MVVIKALPDILHVIIFDLDAAARELHADALEIHPVDVSASANGCKDVIRFDGQAVSALQHICISRLLRSLFFPIVFRHFFRIMAKFIGRDGETHQHVQ